MALPKFALLAASTYYSANGDLVDVSAWVGATYLPSSASSNIWWHWFDDYVPTIRRDLERASQLMGITALRVFLHSTVYDADSDRLLTNIGRFLDLAASHKLGVGLVFFDDCFNRGNLSLETVCEPVKAYHNGCWYASPQDADRGSPLERFKPYVEETVRRFSDDGRVLWWEGFNEPHKVYPESLTLRDAAYKWIKDLDPNTPVLNNYGEDAMQDGTFTDVVNLHYYENTLGSALQPYVFVNPEKSTLVTEAGCRWYQGAEDFGSPLEWLHYLETIRRDPRTLFVPGAMIAWELMVSNTNTRWSWADSHGSPEPAVPWCGWLFPDGTPVSYTEVGALRRYLTGRNEFLLFENFLPADLEESGTDKFLTVDAGSIWHADVAGLPNVLVETAFWLEDASGSFSLGVHTRNESFQADGLAQAGNRSASVGRPAQDPQRPAQGYFVTVTTSKLKVTRREAGIDEELQSTSLQGLEPRVALAAWSMLRVRVADGRVDVWLNPSFPETGFESDADDRFREPLSLPPRLATVDPRPLSAGGVAAFAHGSASLMDYISALPSDFGAAATALV